MSVSRAQLYTVCTSSFNSMFVLFSAKSFQTMFTVWLLQNFIDINVFFCTIFHIYIYTQTFNKVIKYLGECTEEWFFFSLQNHSVYDSTQFDTNATPINPLYAASLQSPDSITGYSIDSQEAPNPPNGYQQWAARKTTVRRALKDRRSKPERFTQRSNCELAGDLKRDSTLNEKLDNFLRRDRRSSKSEWDSVMTICDSKEGF